MDFKQLALDTAAASPCEKRKVGAVLTDGKLVFKGVNHERTGNCCEDEQGNTKDTVVHAEVSVVNDLRRYIENNSFRLERNWTLYVTHQPCANCIAEIHRICVTRYIEIEVKVVKQFMKFDSGKLAFDLIPASWERYDAEVLTKGAQKYKPNNWKEIKPEEILRYYAATRRHMLAWLEFMEGKEDSSLFDDSEMGIGTHHLANARTNLGFLLTLTETLEKAEEIKNGSK